MAVELNPYIGFADGRARAAMEFYQSVFGGDLHISTFGDFGMPDAPADGVMHAVLSGERGVTIMGSDAPPGMEPSNGQAVSLSLSGDDEVLRDLWAKLADGGEVTLPMATQAWGDEFGMLTDRFGTAWMVNISARPAQG